MTTESSIITCALPLSNWTLHLIIAVTVTLLVKQHAIVSIQLNIVTCAMCPEKFIRANDILCRSYYSPLSLSLCHS